ncbi:MAG: 4-hydroxybenzoate octaprenyltransferase [Cellvibrionales bacterium]|nr:4-hydroxybenzoate octaprenyltransferase [Cellvibrionales bacterium]
MHLTTNHIPHYLTLIRFDRPIGSLLLLWPTLWSLWLAAGGLPSIKNLIIFTLGVFLMRSAGCAINDYADRDFDGQVKRTKDRPLATGAITKEEALSVFGLLAIAAFILVLMTNWLTIVLSLGGLALAAIYPFMKRYTYFPQVFLGLAYSWSVIMAFAAESNSLPKEVWLIYVCVVVWTVVYDTFYAMVDRKDDLNVGIKSTAILFGDYDLLITSIMQMFVVFVWLLIGYKFELGIIYYLAVIFAAGLFAFQQWRLSEGAKHIEKNAFWAFLNNNWVGLVIFLGIALDYAIR